jgi:hypothetical protein
MNPLYWAETAMVSNTLSQSDLSSLPDQLPHVLYEALLLLRSHYFGVIGILEDHGPRRAGSPGAKSSVALIGVAARDRKKVAVAEAAYGTGQGQGISGDTLKPIQGQTSAPAEALDLKARRTQAIVTHHKK